ncbi:MAG: sulfur carrier protein ThiS [Desulfuromonadales bacterium]|nr:sulfur carrier protein ThiS [Desulfuromonadales bacterium]
MNIVVNGEAHELRDGSTIADLLDLLGIGRERVAVERNLDIVPRARHAEQVICDGDRIEIVQFVGGG